MTRKKPSDKPPTGIRTLDLNLDELVGAAVAQKGACISVTSDWDLSISQQFLIEQGFDPETASARLYYSPTVRQPILHIIDEQRDGFRRLAKNKRIGAKRILNLCDEPERWRDAVLRTEKVFVPGLGEVWLLDKPKGEQK